jgi:hypothetical protein
LFSFVFKTETNHPLQKLPGQALFVSLRFKNENEFRDSGVPFADTGCPLVG